MLKLSVIVHNPAGDIAIAWLGMVPLALVASMIVGVWLVVLARRARPDETADNRGAEAVRRPKLIVQRPDARREAKAPATADRKRGPPVGAGRPTAR